MNKLLNNLSENLLEEKKITKTTFALFTGLFLIMILGIYSYFVVVQKSFIWEGDGYSQHYLIFKDYLALIREFFAQPSAGFQLWDWSNGMGADLFASYGYYVLGDPFVYLRLLFPTNMTELAFHVLILVRVYFIGIAFLAYCSRMKVYSSGALVGSIMYTFTFYVILNVTRHPFFLMPMIFFPLLCVGIEKILHNESNNLFIFMIFISACSNFYFFYMLSVLSFIYAVIRYFHLYGTKNINQIFYYIWKSVYSYLIGLLLSGFLFVPVVWGFLQSSREPGEFASGLNFYPVKYYWSLFLNLFISERYLWTVFGFSAFVLLLIPMLWIRRKKFGFISSSIALFGVMLLLPAFGSIMNGFAGPYNRWTFVLPLFFSLGAALLYNQRFDLKKNELKAMGITLLLYSLMILLISSVIGFRIAYVMPLFFALILLIILIAANKQKTTQTLTRKYKKTYSAVLLLLIMGNLAYNAMDYYYPWGQGTIELSLDYGTVDEDYLDTFGQIEQQLPKDDEISRIGVTSKDNHVKNQLIILDQMGLNSYLSVTNGPISNFARELETGQFQLIQPLRNGFDDRRIANNFLGVRYIITEAANQKYLPYGYEVIDTKEADSDYIVAETQDYFPFAYANTTYLTKELAEEMNPIEKELFLSYGTVIDSENVETSELTLFDRSLAIDTLDYKLDSKDQSKVTINQDKINVKEDNGTIELVLEDPTALQDSEVYVYLEGLNFTPKVSDPLNGTPTSYSTRVTLGERKKSIYQSNQLSFSSYFKRNKMLFNMGYQEGDSQENTISIQLSKAGEYDIEDITIFSAPLDKQYSSRVAEKRAQQLNIETFNDHMVSGSIYMSDPSILTTTIPYTKGWKAEVNGEEIETIQVNEGFIGIPLKAGTSNVTFRYKTPFLRLGAIISLIGLVLVLVNGFFWNKPQKKH